MKIKTISPDEHIFIKVLSTLAKKPKALYYRGKLPESRVPTVAIVGTRKPTAYGKEVTHQLAFELAKRGVVIVSGLALGVDAIAHQAALEAGGTTIAVLPGSVEEIYPRTHRGLANKIIEQGGAVVSEYEPGREVYKTNFLERNRIVSGIADAVIVTEAARHSGTMSTVAHALEQNKEVFAVPGNITSPMSEGCNTLLKQGAHPALSVEDILEVIAPELLKRQTTLPLGNTPLETTIIQLLQSGIRDGDELLIRSGAPASEFSSALTMLEIAGTIRALGGNQWSLK